MTRMWENTVVTGTLWDGWTHRCHWGWQLMFSKEFLCKMQVEEGFEGLYPSLDVIGITMTRSPASRLFTEMFIQAQIKDQSPASLAFVRGIQQEPVNSPHSYAENVSIWWRHHGMEMATANENRRQCMWFVILMDHYNQNIFWITSL